MKLRSILISADQFINVLFGGMADETVSSRCWRLRHRQPYKTLRAVIDGFFFFQPDHCRKSYENELARRDGPKET